MENKVICDFKAQLVSHTGVSTKTGKSYEFLTLTVDTGVFGVVDVKLNTVNDRAGIVFKFLADNYG